MSGNPVEIGDGCATVTGYKLPQPLAPLSGAGKAGVRVEARSQDTGLVVLVRLVPPCGKGHFSVQEKDEASRFRACGAGFSNAFIL